jgi:hypothetical protein
MRFQHLLDYHQTYFSHLQDAWSFSARSLKASIAFFIHGLYPDIFVSTGSNEIKDLAKITQDKRKKLE